MAVKNKRQLADVGGNNAARDIAELIADSQAEDLAKAVQTISPFLNLVICTERVGVDLLSGTEVDESVLMAAEWSVKGLPTMAKSVLALPKKSRAIAGSMGRAIGSQAGEIVQELMKRPPKVDNALLSMADNWGVGLEKTKEGETMATVTEDCKTRITNTTRLSDQFEQAVYDAMFDDGRPTIRNMNKFLKDFRSEGLYGDPERDNPLREEFAERVNFVCEKRNWQLYAVPKAGGDRQACYLDVRALRQRQVNRVFLVRDLKSDATLWENTQVPELSVGRE